MTNYLSSLGMRAGRTWPHRERAGGGRACNLRSPRYARIMAPSLRSVAFALPRCARSLPSLRSVTVNSKKVRSLRTHTECTRELLTFCIVFAAVRSVFLFFQRGFLHLDALAFPHLVFYYSARARFETRFFIPSTPFRSLRAYDTFMRAW